MRYNFPIILGAIMILAGCSEQSVESQPESGHTALGTSAPPAVNPTRTDSLNYLSQYIGQRPDSVELWETEPLRMKLEELLGGNFGQFIKIMKVATPLKQERVLYTLSSNDEQGQQAFLLIDVENNTLHVSIIADGIRKQFQTPGEDLHIPYEIEQLL